MATTLTEIKGKEGAWVALIYLPQKEHQSPDPYTAIMNPSVMARPLVYPYSIQMPPEAGGDGLPVSFSESIMLRPGANLQVLAEKWAIALKDKMVQHRLSIGAIEVVNCQSTDDSAPGYRHFDDKTALDLVRKTEDIDSINTWLKGEARAVVIEAANTKKAEIEAELAKRAA